MDEREKVEAGEALMRWIENWSGESGETTEATQEDIEAIWFGAWEASRAAAREVRTGNPALDEHARFEGQRLRGDRLPPERLEQIRSYLEQTDPWRGEHTRARTEHDIRLLWELLLGVEHLRDLAAARHAT